MVLKPTILHDLDKARPRNVKLYRHLVVKSAICNISGF